MPEPILSASTGRTRRPVYEPPAPMMRPRRSRLLMIGLPVLAMFAALAAIVWVAYEDTGAPVGEPPLIKAEPGPIKLAPDEPGGLVVADQGEVRELLGDPTPQQPAERLLPPPDQPLTPTTPQAAGQPAVQAVPAVPASPQPSAQPTPEPVQTGQIGTPTPTPQQPAPPVITAQPAPAPPQTTSQQQAAAPQIREEQAAQIQPPGVGESPAEAEAALDALLAEVQPEAVSPAPAPAIQPAPQPQVTVPPPAPQPQATQPPTPAPSTSVAVVTPPVGQPQVQTSTPTAPAPVSPPATTAPATPAPTTTAATTPRIEPVTTDESVREGIYRIQLAAVRDETDARRAWDLFQLDLGPVLTGLKAFIERAETANGIFYRVQVGPFTNLTEAEALCEELKQRNASCFVVRR